MGLLKVIFIIIVGFYLFGLIGRLYLRYWIAKKQKEFEQTGRTGGYSFKQYSWGGDSNRNFGNSDNARSAREGEIKVEQSSATQKKVNKQVGDYVDYEEIKDEQN